MDIFPPGFRYFRPPGGSSVPAVCMKHLLEAHHPKGSDIHYTAYGDPTKPVLVLVHGYLVTGQMFDPLLEYLADDFRLLVTDNRGFGQNDALPGPYTLAQMAKDVLTVTDLEAVETFHLLGYSKGGAVAQLAALLDPDRIKTLTLTVTFSYKSMTAFERWQRTMLRTVVGRVGPKGLARLIPDGIAGGINLQARDLVNVKRMLRNLREDVALEVGHEIFKFDTRAYLGQLTMPTLVLAGSDDIVVPIHHARYLAAKLPNNRLKVLPNAGHGLIYTHTAEMAKHVRNFIAAHEPELEPA